MLKEYKVKDIKEWLKILNEQTNNKFAENTSFIINYYLKNNEDKKLDTIKDVLDFYVFVEHQEKDAEVGCGEMWNVLTTAVPQDVNKVMLSLRNKLYKKQENVIKRRLCDLGKQEENF